jgi:hypothetical protein
VKDNDFKNLTGEDLGALLGVYLTTRSDITPAIFKGAETPRGQELVEEVQRRLKLYEPNPQGSRDTLPHPPFTYPLDACFNLVGINAAIKEVHDLMQAMVSAGKYPTWWPPLITAQLMFEDVIRWQRSGLCERGAMFAEYMVVFPTQNNKVLKAVNTEKPNTRYTYPAFFFIAMKKDKADVLETE